jgi:hypothetical protein
VLSGWRLLSDELALVDRKSGPIIPLPSPVSLKNQSIPLIQAFSSAAFINRPAHDTAKGTVAHMRPPTESVRRQHEPARPAWVIFPKWTAGAATTLTPRSAAQTFMFLAQNAFNYSHSAQTAFVGSLSIRWLLRFYRSSIGRGHGDTPLAGGSLNMRLPPPAGPHPSQARTGALCRPVGLLVAGTPAGCWASAHPVSTQ